MASRSFGLLRGGAGGPSQGDRHGDGARRSHCRAIRITNRNDAWPHRVFFQLSWALCGCSIGIPFHARVSGSGTALASLPSMAELVRPGARKARAEAEAARRDSAGVRRALFGPRLRGGDTTWAWANHWNLGIRSGDPLLSAGAAAFDAPRSRRRRGRRGCRCCRCRMLLAGAFPKHSWPDTCLGTVATLLSNGMSQLARHGPSEGTRHSQGAPKALPEHAEGVTPRSLGACSRLAKENRPSRGR